MTMSVEELGMMLGNPSQQFYALLKVPDLIAPLSKDSQSILQESDNDKEAANCG
jgi:hypothetical protein